MKSNEQVANTLAFVLAGGAGRRLDPLTRYRPKPLVPFGGHFRIIDFTLSNCLNSGLDCAYVLTQHESDAVAGYLRKGWSGVEGHPRDFAIAIPAATGKRYKGTADAVLQNVSYLQKHQRLFALVIPADQVYKMDYRSLLSFHAESGADVTIASVDRPMQLSSEMGVLEIGNDSRVFGIAQKTRSLQPTAKSSKAVPVNMGIYVFNYETLLDMVRLDDGGCVDIAANLIPRLIHSHRVKAYRYQEPANGNPLYWRNVGTLETYYDACMDLLESRPLMDPYDDKWLIRSAMCMRPGRNFLSEAGGEDGTSSIIPHTADIRGACVFRSVLSPGVVLESGAEVRHSVLLPGAVIRRGAVVRRAIIDAHVIIEAGDDIGYCRPRDARRFRVLANGVSVVSPDHVSAFNKLLNLERVRAGLRSSHPAPFHTA
jgi:glucose-1-phosphate adenylyltransferase